MWLAAPMMLGCSPDEPTEVVQTTTVQEPTVRLVNGKPEAAAEPAEVMTYSALGYVVAVAGIGSSPIVGTTVEASTLFSGQLGALEIWGEGPLTTGRVRAVLRRSENVLVAADNGLFHTVADKLVLSPADAVLSELNIQAMYRSSGAAAETLWFVTPDQLYQLKGDKLFRWTIDGADAATIGAVLVGEDKVYIGAGATLYALDPIVKKAEVTRYNFGRINVLALGLDGKLQIASDRGLFVAEGENSYVHYTFSNDGDVAAVDGVALDPKQGTFVVTGEDILLRTGGDKFKSVAVLPKTEAPRQISFDDVGNLWIGDDQSVHALALGTPVGFAEDVAPILEKHCMSCHGEPPTDPDEKAPAANFVDYKTAKEYGASLVLRISSGQMPPPGTEEPVSPQDFALIQRWYEGGLNP